MTPVRLFVKSVKKSAVSKFAELTGEVGSCARPGELVASRSGNMPSWAADNPQVFWRAAFQHERQNGSVCRVYDIALPEELSVEQNLELSDRYISALTSNKPYQGELLNVRRGALENTSLHLRLVVSEREEDGIERSPEQTFKRFDAAHPERGGRRKNGCGKSKVEMGSELKETRRMLAELQDHALLEAIRPGSPQRQASHYEPGQRGQERLHAYTENKPRHFPYCNAPGDVVYCVS